MEEIRKQGLSKGCLVGLIVAGALLVLFIVIGVTCYFKRDDLMRFGVAQLMNSVKIEVAKQQFTGVDSADFDRVTDAFVVKLNNSEMQYQPYQKFMTVLQSVSADKKIDSAEVYQLIDAMIAYYPDLTQFRLPGTQLTPANAADSITPPESTLHR